MRLNSSRRREGTVVVVAAVSIVAVLSFVALSLDAGMLLDKRRSAQATADAAAYAAACEIYVNWFANKGADDTNATAKNLALAVAKENGYENGVNGVTVTVNIPPLSGPNAGKKGHAEVLIKADQPRAFSRIYGPTEKVPVGARAVARGMRTTNNNGIIVLHPDLKGALSVGGGGTATVTGSAHVIVNSVNMEAMVANGGGSVTASSFDVGGDPGWSTPGGGAFIGPIHSGSDPTPDPLRFVPEPDPSAMTVRSTKKLSHSSANTITLKPGVYEGGIQITGKGSVVMESGVYYMRGGGFSVSGTDQGSLTGNGVVIFNKAESNSDTISLSGSGAITLTPPAAGPYQGITLFQHRGTVQPTVSVSGNGSSPMYLTGTFYVPKGELSVTGNGTQDTIGAQYISDTLKVGGNGSFNVSWDPDVIPGIRSIYLVE